MLPATARRGRRAAVAAARRWVPGGGAAMSRVCGRWLVAARPACALAAYSQRRASTTRHPQAKFSNGVVAAVLFIPLVIT